MSSRRSLHWTFAGLSRIFGGRLLRFGLLLCKVQRLKLCRCSSTHGPWPLVQRPCRTPASAKHLTTRLDHKACRKHRVRNAIATSKRTFDNTIADLRDMPPSLQMSLLHHLLIWDLLIAAQVQRDINRTKAEQQESGAAGGTLQGHFLHCFGRPEAARPGIHPTSLAVLPICAWIHRDTSTLQLCHALLIRPDSGSGRRRVSGVSMVAMRGP